MYSSLNNVSTMVAGSGCSLFVILQKDFPRFQRDPKKNLFESPYQGSIVHGPSHFGRYPVTMWGVVAYSNTVVLGVQGVCHSEQKRLSLVSTLSQHTFQDAISFLPPF
jgi:hypothetical protein